VTGRVCVLGSINVDLVVRTPRLPKPGETILGGPFDRSPGGKGANQAVAAARAGATVEMVGALGDDDHGRAMRAMLEGERIGAAGVRTIQGAPTGIALITVDERGENTIVVAAGANALVDQATVKAGAPTIKAADILLMQLEIPVASVAIGASMARTARTRVALNAAPATQLPTDLLDDLDILIVNRGEAGMLAGLDADLPPEALAQSLVRRGIRTVAITLGAQGAVILDADSLHVIPAFRVNAVDTVGAGDAFAGALCAALAEGRDIHAAATFACAAGALATVTHGAVPSLPARSDIEWLVKESEK
jgi:ribokinase